VKRTLSLDQDEVVTQSSSDVADEEEDVSMLVMRRWMELARLSLLAYEVSETPMFGSSTPGFGLN
jgi:hypothetical protein